MTLTSPAFADGELIPPAYTCDGKNVSAPLLWRDVPDGTRSFVLIVDDPDAPGGLFLHWLLYDLPAGTSTLPEGIGAEGDHAGGGRQGKNGFGRIGYGGPCPPGGIHRYYFRLHALDTLLEIPSGASREPVENAMRPHVLASAELIGRYRRALRGTA